jgi:rubredoxin
MRENSEYVTCPCCGERMQFVRTGSRANRSEMQTFECKPCGLVVATEALRGSTQPLLERRYYY